MILPLFMETVLSTLWALFHVVLTAIIPIKQRLAGCKWLAQGYTVNGLPIAQAVVVSVKKQNKAKMKSRYQRNIMAFMNFVLMFCLVFTFSSCGSWDHHLDTVDGEQFGQHLIHHLRSLS